MAMFRFFKMAAAAVLDFQNLDFVSVKRAKRLNMRHDAKLRGDRRSVKPLPRYGDFLFFQDGGRLPSWICDARVWTTHEEYLVVFIDVQY